MKFLIILMIFNTFILFADPPQITIGDGLTGQDLLDYIITYYKPSSTLGYENAKDILYSEIDLHNTDQLT